VWGILAFLGESTNLPSLSPLNTEGMEAMEAHFSLLNV